MAEWFIAPVLKTGDLKRSVGSNPTPSAIFRSRRSTMVVRPLCKRMVAGSNPVAGSKTYFTGDFS